MGKVKDMLGKKTGLLTVVSFVGIVKSNAVWVCSCGTWKPKRDNSMVKYEIVEESK